MFVMFIGWCWKSSGSETFECECDGDGGETIMQEKRGKIEQDRKKHDISRITFDEKYWMDGEMKKWLRICEKLLEWSENVLSLKWR